MKAYPLIYSRTKNVDFVPDFLTRPADLDWQTALKYIGNAVASLDTLNAIRYSAFSVGNYCICGGISCITKKLVEQIKISPASLNEISEYLKDCKGRSIACFIGFAIPKSEVRSGRIPDVQLSDYWDNYLKHLKKQWNNITTSSEKLDSLNFEPIELKEKTYSSLYKPALEEVKGKTIVRNFSENVQGTLYYYFDRILNKKEEVSFISDIIYKSDWDILNFNNVSVSDNLYHLLTSTSQSKSPEESFESIMNKSYNRSPSVSSYCEGNEDGFGNVMGNDWKNKTGRGTKSSPYSIGQGFDENSSKKNLLVVAIAAIVVVILIILIMKLK